MVFAIKKATTRAGDEYSFGYKVADKDYFSYVVCSNDTLYSCRTADRCWRDLLTIRSAMQSKAFR